MRLIDDDYDEELDEETKEFMNQTFKFAKAESEAFAKAGFKIGRVEFTCPICGGKAVGNRYEFRGSIHGLGSGCQGCGFRHS